MFFMLGRMWILQMWVRCEYLPVLSESGLRRKGFLQRENNIKNEGNVFLESLFKYLAILKRLSNELYQLCMY